MVYGDAKIAAVLIAALQDDFYARLSRLPLNRIGSSDIKLLRYCLDSEDHERLLYWHITTRIKAEICTQDT